MNRLLITLGASLILLGLAWPWIKRLPLFHLPGDIVIDRPGLRFLFPITTMLLISAVISIIAWVLRKAL
jgi:ribose/xylose/arabinose/galactoside ABC-type transport system permease subunit